MNVLFAGLMNFLCLCQVANFGKGFSAGWDLPGKRRLAYAGTLAIPVWSLICLIIGLPLTGIGDFFLFGLAL